MIYYTIVKMDEMLSYTVSKLNIPARGVDKLTVYLRAAAFN